MRIVIVRGTGEPYGHNMIMDALLGTAHELVELQYPAQIMPIGWYTLGQSEQLGRQALATLDAEGVPWWGIGYSLGAMTLGDYVELDAPRNCLGVIQIADPLRAFNQVTNAGVDPRSWGCAGQRAITAVPWHSFAIPDDPIASCPGVSGFRNIANMVTGLAQPTPETIVGLADTMTEIERYLIGNPNPDLADGFHLSRHCAYGVEAMSGTTQTYMQAVRALVDAL